MLKYFLALFLLSTCAIAFSPEPQEPQLPAKECSRGPIFWCKNIINAKNCNAVKHCIQTVWEHQKPLHGNDEDDDICNLCKAMVTDARNQLESNETVDMIKEVFERSCKLILLKPVVKECIKFADEYAEELVDMLGSYMSPDMICTVAGLCSSAKYDEMYADALIKKLRDEERNAELQKDCEPCMDLAEYIQRQIELATPDKVKAYLKDKCNFFGSYSLACANVVDHIMPVLYPKIVNDYTPASFCHLTSACINGYGRRIQVKTESDSGVIAVNEDVTPLPGKHLSDQQTCKLCETMANRLRNILVSNTTEIEFKQMMTGICKQTGAFRAECLHLTHSYYDQVYHFLVDNFNATDACIFIGLCDPPTFFHGVVGFMTEPPSPAEEAKTGRVPVAKSNSGTGRISPAPGKIEVKILYGDPFNSKYQLPLRRISILKLDDLKLNNRESCMLCEYLLHYIQKVISQPYGENAVKKAVDKMCDELPETITVQCKSFVQQFGDAFVAILAQEIDPSQVCPALRVCPSKIVGDRFLPLEMEGAPGCPLCLMVVEDITEKLKDNRTEDAIRNALHSLCERMSKNLRPQCNEFVQKYTEQVVDMMIADFTPQEVCTYLKLCHTRVDVELLVPYPEEKHEVLTNEVPRGEEEKEGEAVTEAEETVVHEIKAQPKATVEEVKENNNQRVCILCEFVMDKVKDQLKGNETEQEMRSIVSGACRSIPKIIESDCHDFVDKYSKYIVEMLENDVDPGMVCLEMHMCKELKGIARLEQMIRAVEECAICEGIVGAIRGLLEDKNFDRNVSRHAIRICYMIPYLQPYQMDKCKSIVLSYGPSVINLLVELGVRPALVCSRIQLCDETEQAKVHLIESSSEVPVPAHPQQRPHLVGGNSCTWGPAYWCQSEDHAKECGTLAHCREVVWKADRPTPAA